MVGDAVEDGDVLVQGRKGFDASLGGASRSDARGAGAPTMRVCGAAIGAYDGVIVKTTGDGVHVAFATALEVIDAAVVAPLAFGNEAWDATGSWQVRMGLHAGAAQVRAGACPAFSPRGLIDFEFHGARVAVSYPG
jgi:hypothetical protein